MYREIFRIRDEISAHEPDPSATFYDILGITTSASQEDINRAYRKKSRSLHPDKVKQQLRLDRAKAAGGKAVKQPTASEVKAAIKAASERQARLSLIANILRGPSRERYDHFLNHGFPLWKGTDYYYTRYRPGLGTVVFGLFVIGGGAIHYLILYMSWKRQKEFVERYVKFARDTAWGDNLGIPGIETPPATAAASANPSDDEGPPMPMNRRQRRMQEKESKKEEGGGRSKKKTRKLLAASREASSAPTPAGVRKRVVAENGKILVVDSQGDVFLEEEDEDGIIQEYLLDPNELHQPTFKDTAVVRVPAWFYNKSIGRFASKSATVDSDDAADADDSDAPQPTPSTDSAGEDFEMLDKSTDSLAKAKASGAQQSSKANKRRGKKR
ncbi:hypothetical protein HIM_04056 [Hirsutella minnesotensis 3608]|uniref:J domain-containing protein n=1 Tax=Hirsutella minnesotensis 3608 TaxID=1043627 RepID=A0A0F7ZQ67_9HYPO|nr:hypothetical protein HIM_04056 [Hirsutella minnesotensis 3608]